LKLSVIIPVYNESGTLEEVIRRVQAVRVAVPVGYTYNGETPHQVVLDKEIILVDDGSSDCSADIIRAAAQSDDVVAVFNDLNQGKGAAIRAGLNQASGDIVVVQDADLEYDPRDYVILLQPILEERAKVVYGSRFRGGPTKAMFFTHMLGNKFLTLVTNLLYDTIITDMETCYKCFRADVVKDLPLRARGFDFEPEFTAKVLKRGYRIYEVPISYNGREFDEGKKLNPWREGPLALWTLVKYRFVD
jgi:glycosyltransferase involved in cell wall biosynthesis